LGIWILKDSLNLCFGLSGKIRVENGVIRHGKYKSAVEPF
jgi:hypothetical protein